MTLATSQTPPPDEARAVVWRLFEHGRLDADAATAALLALDCRQRAVPPARLPIPPPARGNWSGVALPGRSWAA